MPPANDNNSSNNKSGPSSGPTTGSPYSVFQQNSAQSLINPGSYAGFTPSQSPQQFLNNFGSFSPNGSSGSPFYNSMSSGQNFVGAPSNGNGFVPDGSSGFPFINQMQYPAGYKGIPNNFGQTAQPDLSAGDSLYQGLMSELANLSGPSDGDLQKQAQQQAGMKYDPLIQQLQQSLGTAQANEGAASNKIGDLYSSLGKGLAAQIPVITNQFANAENQSQQNYQTLLNQIHSNYQGAQQAQAAELQKLGIQAALPQSTEKLGRDEQYLAGQAQTNGQALNDNMRSMGQGQADFAQRASMIAPQTGAGLQADLAQKLLQLQNTTNQQITGYKGQEAADAAALLSQLQNASQKNLSTQQNDAISNAMKTAQLLNLTHPGIYGPDPNKVTTQSYKGQSGVSKFIQDNVTDPQHASALQGAFNDFYNSPDNAKLTGVGGVGSPTLPVELQALAQFEQKKNPTMPTNDLQTLNTLLAIMNGKYQ
jgi:hypothetical protein